MPATKYLKTTIILAVKDIYDTVAWYQRVLEFQTRYIHGAGRRGEERDFANYAILIRDAVEVQFIMDESNDGGGDGRGWMRPGNGYLGLVVSDVDAAYASVRAAGVKIDSELQKLNWPARGFDLRDPDNNAIHIEQPV
ncbi:MAG: VOC family protein [Burkholderiales bacterium]|nr:VOC family protein [Phycisphaerae bacterium]